MSEAEDMVLAVVFDRRSGGLGDIVFSLQDVTRLVFAVQEDEFTAKLAPHIAEAGAVVYLTGDVDVDAAALARHRPRGLVTYSETLIRAAAALAHALDLPFHSPETARLLTDKLLQRRALRTVDEVVTASVSAEHEWQPALDRVGLPAIVKPVRGFASKGVNLLRTLRDAESLKAELFPAEEGGLAIASAPLLVEEYLEGRPCEPFGDYVSVESVTSSRGVTHVAVTGKFPMRRPFAEQGAFWPSQLDEDELTQVLDLVGRTLAALGVKIGVTHTEVQLTAKGPRIIEVNGRVGGHVNDIAKRSGAVDLVRVNGLIALGLEAKIQPVRLDAVHFQRFYLAPAEPSVFRGVHGVREARRIPGITGFTILASVGEHLEGGVHGQRIGLLHGRVPDHAAMIETVEKALSVLNFEFGEPESSAEVI
jgi:biotin carboxylase